MSASEQGLQALQLYNIKFGGVTFIMTNHFSNFYSRVTGPYFVMCRNHLVGAEPAAAAVPPVSSIPLEKISGFSVFGRKFLLHKLRFCGELI